MTFDIGIAALCVAILFGMLLIVRSSREWDRTRERLDEKNKIIPITRRRKQKKAK